MPFDANTRVVASSAQVSVTFEQEVVILQTDAGLYFGLDDIGTRIWELVAEPVRLGDIVRSLTARYDVSEAQCLSDVVTLCEALAGRGLLDVVGDAAR